MKRIQKVTHRYGCKVFCKNQSQFILPVHAFADLWIPGGQYGAKLVGHWEHYYSRELPRDDYLVEMNPFTHGVHITFLPEHSRVADLSGDKDFARWINDSNTAWAAEQVLAMTLPHDIQTTVCHVYAPRITKAAEIYRRHGIALRGDDPRPEAVFTGYWDAPKIVPGDPKMLLSYYQRPESPGVLAVLTNPELDDRTVKLAIDTAALGLTLPLAVRDEFRDEDLPEWETKGIPVPHESFRLLWIRPAAP
jgi:hypothetical protein